MLRGLSPEASRVDAYVCTQAAGRTHARYFTRLEPGSG